MLPNRFNVDLTNFPTVSRVNDACAALDFFKAASFDAQPDTPDDLRRK